MSVLAGLVAAPGAVVAAAVVVVVAVVFGPLVYIAVLKKDGVAHERLLALIGALAALRVRGESATPKESDLTTEGEGSGVG